ncbi:hypothetical protein ACHAW5_003441 [Stephanodiscus triporus]|uniref:Fe2OG dioxygenase domain-containing protein n=1 Tax=Stephanodiscus triporus TaxID=2934178 RepID=A0ABD3NB56_9STRA
MSTINFLLLTLLHLAYNQISALAFVLRRAAATATASSATSLPLAHVEVVTTNQLPALLLERVDKIIDPYVFNNGEIDRKNILNSVDREHVEDVCWAKASSLPFESDRSTCSWPGTWNPTEYESIHIDPGNYSIATRTKKNNPLLTGDEIECLRGASEFYWSRIEGDHETSEKSRFTYQRKGNSEAHLSDVVKYCQRSDLNSYDVAPLVNDLLLNRIYPWIRASYLSREEIGNDLELFVYDSLFIRYNTTAANLSNDTSNGSGENLESVGAGQPLHRDLGYVSVNIMLNEEFEGGGTFFEDQLLSLVLSGNYDNEIQPLKPLGPGHAIAHYSKSRHAGAATYAGVRDILVIFLAAKEKTQFTDANRMWKAPCWERNARLKVGARTYCSVLSKEDQMMCRILHHRLAIDQVMDDGEAWHYLGMAILDYNDHLQLSDIARGGITSMEMELAVACLNEAAKHTPCDGRLYNNLGIALERLMHCQASNSRIMIEQREKAAEAYKKSMLIHSTCQRMRCNVHADHISTCLNYGLYLSKLDQFGCAIDILSRIVHQTDTLTDADNDLDEIRARQRVVRDAKKLLAFCKSQRLPNPRFELCDGDDCPVLTRAIDQAPQ